MEAPILIPKVVVEQNHWTVMTFHGKNGTSVVLNLVVKQEYRLGSENCYLSSDVGPITVMASSRNQEAA